MLFLSFCMPPLKYPRSIQISRLIKNMTVKPSVIYADEKTNLDFTIIDDFDQYVKSKIQIPFQKNNRYFSYMKRIFFPMFYQTPDLQKYWANKLFIIANEQVEKNNEDIIVTFGQPMSVHLAGLKLKKKNPNIKWIAHFSDPWVNNPLDNKGFLVKIINKYLEKNVFKYADTLIFTSKETIDLIKEKNPSLSEYKIKYLSHSYDSSNYDYSVKNETKNFIIRYIGGFYSQRSPKPLFEAISSIVKSDKKLLNNVLFEIIGNLGRHSSLLKDYEDIHAYINFIDNVTYKTSLKLMVSSDVLLVIDAPSKKSIFFPSKLVDYIGSKKPIVAITPEGTTKRIINELDGKTADPSDIDAIVYMLKDILFNKNSYKSFVPNNNYLKYDAAIVAQEFMDIIENV